MMTAQVEQLLAERFYEMTKCLPEFCPCLFSWFLEELALGSLVVFRWDEDSFEVINEP